MICGLCAAGLGQFMLQQHRCGLLEVSRDGLCVRLRSDAVARVQRKRVILDHLYAPLGNLPTV